MIIAIISTIREVRSYTSASQDKTVKVTLELPLNKNEAAISELIVLQSRDLPVYVTVMDEQEVEKRNEQKQV